MDRKIAIGFVIYIPPSNVFERFSIALAKGFSVYVFDNSPSFAKEFPPNLHELKYATYGRNVGLGIGLSHICDQAYRDGHSALLFFDQDTVFNTATLSCVEDYYTQNTAAFSAYSAIAFNSKNYSRAAVDPRECFRDVLLAINSGSLFNLTNAKKMNWHNKNYFVDCVDYEYCLNSMKHNFKIGEYSCASGFDHSTEQDEMRYKIFGRTYPMRAYATRRVLDKITASARLIVDSVLSGQLRFAAMIIRLVLVYVAIQLFVRILNFANATRS